MNKNELKAALAAVIAWQECVTGVRVHTVKTLDLNGTCFELKGQAFPEDLGAAIARAFANGILVIPATDNNNASIDAWLSHGNVASWMMPVRVTDHGTRIVVNRGGRVHTHFLAQEDHMLALEAGFVSLRGKMERYVREQLGLTAVRGHPSIRYRARPQSGHQGVAVLDWHRRLGVGIELRMCDAAGLLHARQDLTEELARLYWPEAEKLGLTTAEAFEVIPEFLYHVPHLPTVKVDAMHVLHRCLPSRIGRLVHIGDTSGNERGTNHLHRVEAFAPFGTSFGSSTGVHMLTRSATDGAVIELVDRLIAER